MSATVVQARQIQKVYSEWCVKAAEIILASRIDDPGTAESPGQTSASFNLKVPELFNVRSEAVARPEFFQLKTQRSFQVEIYLGPPADAFTCEDEAGRLLERWTFTFFPAHPEPTVPDRCNQTLVRKLSVTLRSLMCFTRLLPSFAFCRFTRGVGAKHWRFRVEAWPPTSRTTPAQDLTTQDFVSLQSSVGTLRLSVSQHKDLKSMPVNGPFRNAAAIGSQLDPIEVEESYFANTMDSSPTDAVASLGRLDKIAEEPEAKVSNMRRNQHDAHHNDSAEQPSLSTTLSSVAHEPASARGDRPPRPRLSSEDSNASTMSTSSRAHSLPDHTIILGATPPLASAFCATPPQGLITLGPHHRSDSVCSSRSLTPQTTPKLGPVPEPVAHATGEQRCRATSSSAASAGGVAVGCALAAGVVASAVAAEGRGLLAASLSPGIPSLAAQDHLSSDIYGAAMPPSCQPGEFDDLSSIWMNCPPEWGSRRRSMSLGTASCGSGAYSRSLSPEDAVRLGAVTTSPVMAIEAPGMGSATTTGACSSSAGRSGLRLSTHDGLSEICMFGMSDDEDEDVASDVPGEMERNVVASTIQEGSGAAFATTCLEPEQLGFAGLSLLEHRVSHRPSLRSEASSASPRMLSPLIAQLNPFMPPPILHLPPAGSGGLALGLHGAHDAVSGVRGPEEAAPIAIAVPPEPTGKFEACPVSCTDVHHLLAEMGDLVCKLQQKQELAITSREVSPDELLERLIHFKEMASSAELRCHS